MRITAAQREVCERFGVRPLPPRRGTLVGIATSRGRDLVPLTATRRPPAGRNTGWYVWRGGPVPHDRDGFFVPVPVERIGDHAPELVPYLAMPPGWGVVLAPDYEDVWQLDP